MAISSVSVGLILIDPTTACRQLFCRLRRGFLIATPLTTGPPAHWRIQYLWPVPC